MGGTASSAEFATAASNEGALGNIGSLYRTNTAVKRDIDVVQQLTNEVLRLAIATLPATPDTVEP
jgi:NAD(P)H-dependent flavin oxidoreductase YrpB (nitropropane dioxygenase family)